MDFRTSGLYVQWAITKRTIHSSLTIGAFIVGGTGAEEASIVARLETCAAILACGVSALRNCEMESKSIASNLRSRSTRDCLMNRMMNNRQCMNCFVVIFASHSSRPIYNDEQHGIWKMR